MEAVMRVVAMDACSRDLDATHCKLSSLSCLATLLELLGQDTGNLLFTRVLQYLWKDGHLDRLLDNLGFTANGAIAHMTLLVLAEIASSTLGSQALLQLGVVHRLTDPAQQLPLQSDSTVLHSTLKLLATLLLSLPNHKSLSTDCAKWLFLNVSTLTDQLDSVRTFESLESFRCTHAVIFFLSNLLSGFQADTLTDTTEPFVTDPCWEHVSAAVWTLLQHLTKYPIASRVPNVHRRYHAFWDTLSDMAAGEVVESVAPVGIVGALGTRWSQLHDRAMHVWWLMLRDSLSFLRRYYALIAPRSPLGSSWSHVAVDVLELTADVISSDVQEPHARTASEITYHATVVAENCLALVHDRFTVPAEPSGSGVVLASSDVALQDTLRFLSSSVAALFQDESQSYLLQKLATLVSDHVAATQQATPSSSSSGGGRGIASW
jgi:hypothetical protein